MDPLELELQKVVGHLGWTCGPSEKQPVILTTELSVQPSLLVFVCSFVSHLIYFWLCCSDPHIQRLICSCFSVLPPSALSTAPLFGYMFTFMPGGCSRSSQSSHRLISILPEEQTILTESQAITGGPVKAPRRKVLWNSSLFLSSYFIKSWFASLVNCDLIICLHLLYILLSSLQSPKVMLFSCLISLWEGLISPRCLFYYALLFSRDWSWSPSPTSRPYFTGSL